MIEDIALMRAMPKMQVVVPADYNQAYTAVIESYERDGPMYMRFGRPRRRSSTTRSPTRSGPGRAAQGQGHLDLRLRPHGLARLEAAEALEREDGVEAEVVNVSIIKPIDSEAVLESLAKTGVGVTAEEHRVVGGLADAIRGVAAEQHPVPVFALGMGDEFGVSGTAEACMEHFGLTSNGIADLAREALLKKPIVSHPPIHGVAPGRRSLRLHVGDAILGGSSVPGRALCIVVGLRRLEVVGVAVAVAARRRAPRGRGVGEWVSVIVLVAGSLPQLLLGELEPLGLPLAGLGQGSLLIGEVLHTADAADLSSFGAASSSSCSISRSIGSRSVMRALP